MTLHHDKHHAAYVNNLNAALEKHPQLASKSVEELLRDINSVPDDIRTAVRNNGGGHMNHTMFWQIMKSKGGGPPSGRISEEIKKTLAALKSFKSNLTTPARSASVVVGFGWCAARLASWRLRRPRTRIIP